jgi:transposase InsO family protein
MRSHLWVPDTQCAPGRPTKHIEWLTRYALDKGPQVIIFAGDWWDLPSLSHWDARGSESSEGRRLQADLDAGRKPMERLLEAFDREGWSPEIHFLMGNHEQRYFKAKNAQPHLLHGDPWDWLREEVIVHDFLEVVKLDGVAYSHFHPANAKGQVTQTRMGAPSAREQCKRLMMSATAGHQQGLDIAILPTPNGMQRGLIAGSFYLHDEEYMGPLNHYWRGLIMKHNVRGGNYTLNEVDMDFLRRKYS